MRRTTSQKTLDGGTGLSHTAHESKHTQTHMQAMAAEAVWVRHCMQCRSEASVCRHTAQRHSSTEWKNEVSTTHQGRPGHRHRRNGRPADCLQLNPLLACMRIALCISTAVELELNRQQHNRHLKHTPQNPDGRHARAAAGAQPPITAPCGSSSSRSGSSAGCEQLGIAAAAPCCRIHQPPTRCSAGMVMGGMLATPHTAGLRYLAVTL